MTELSGNITLKDILDVNPEFLKPLSPEEFSSANELYNLIKKRGSLRLKNCHLDIQEKIGEKISFVFHELELINSAIVIGSNEIHITCNEYQHTGTSVYAFDENNQYADAGADGVKDGADGEDGKRGIDSGDVYIHVTDIIKTTPSGITFELFGQNGGVGGNGKKGSDGRQGERGHSCSDGPFHCRRGPGNGGRGGNGQAGGDAGNGGSGGNGGKVEFRLYGSKDPYQHFFNFQSRGGFGNIGGKPGEGGKGGPGGAPGSRNCSFCSGSGRPGQAGADGANGRPGDLGGNGESMHLLRGNFDYQSLQIFLAGWSNPHKRSAESISQKSDITFG